jgi:TM2 domain-containing membrane protein YozV
MWLIFLAEKGREGLLFIAVSVSMIFLNLFFINYIISKPIAMNYGFG